MQVIISHINTDFDALASLLAAKKLYPEATIVLSDKQNSQVKRFLNIYREQIQFVSDRDIEWSKVTELIMVDVASLQRVGHFSQQLRDDINIIVYDHHPSAEGDVQSESGIIEQVGATITLLVEEIRRQSLPITDFEATIFGLGLYTDTGNFTYNTTTTRDFAVAGYLMECGMNLEMIQRFAEETLAPEQQELLDELFINSETIEIDGLEIVLAAHEQEEFQGGLAVLTQKLLEMKGADAMISIVKMKHHVYIVGRASADRINLQPILQKFGGGGHQHAGSATVKQGDFAATKASVKESLALILQPAITALQIMSTPVKTLAPDTTIEKAGKLMYRYGHSGYPIVEDGKLIGMITRRDLDKANHHGLGHAPVKAYMTTNVIVIKPTTTLEEIQKIVIEHNIGRLPVIDDGRIVGIVTRTNIIEKIHEQTTAYSGNGSATELKENIQEEMEAQLPEQIYTVLQQISRTATETNMNVYLIGGIVRDVLLKQSNDDVDIVVEGDGIAIAKQLQANFGGKLTTHEDFGTATWVHPSQLEIDIASSRLEYYDRPASLPDVEKSTLQEDLYRRDFTINAMAISLNESEFGKLVDPFSGQLDLYNRTIKVLHNLSFVEDPTRILRAVRFETRFSFKMDEQTESLALTSIEQMKDVSAKRIIDEIKRMFDEENPIVVMARLFELNFWQQYTPKQSSNKEALQHARKLHALQTKFAHIIHDDNSWLVYFCIPFFASANLEKVKQFMLTKSDRKLYEDIQQLTKISLRTKDAIGEFHRKLKSISDLAILFTVAQQNLPNESLILDYILKRQKLKPYVTGEDLKQYGIRPGPIYKEILLELEVLILNDVVQSKEAALRWLERYIDDSTRR